MPWSAVAVGGVTAAASDDLDRSTNPSRQPCRRGIWAAGSPRTVIPLMPSALRSWRVHAGPAPLAAARERLVPRQRGGVEHGDERLQVLPRDDVERDGEGGLVAFRADEGRTVALGQKREGEGEREEGDGDSRSSGAAPEGHGGHTRADAAVEDAPGDADERPEQPRRPYRCRERDEPREQQEHEAGPLALVEAGLIGGATDESRDHDGESGESRGVECAETPILTRTRRGGDGDDDRREQDHARGESQPGRGEDALAQHRAHRRAGPSGRERPDGEAHEPTPDGAHERNGGALGHGQEPQRASGGPRTT